MIDQAIIQDWLSCGTLISKDEGRLLIGWGKRHWMDAPAADLDTCSFYFPDFFLLNKTPWFAHEHTMEVSFHELQQELAPKVDLCLHQESEKVSPYVWHNAHQPLFIRTFEQLQSKFVSREIDKAVPFVFESAAHGMGGAQLTASLISVLEYAQINPAYVYGFWESNSGILGATPEILFRFVNGGAKLETMACAGTKSLHSDSAAFLSDPKELHEHQLVVQGITESLAAFGTVHIGDLRLLKLSRLVHLVTPISIELKGTPRLGKHWVQACDLPFEVLSNNVQRGAQMTNHKPDPNFSSAYPSFDAVVRALHPTPAVGAFPRHEGMKWLHDYQTKIDRGRFGAPVGYLMPAQNKANCYVSIRNVQWNESEMMLAAGCGLVKESRCDREWVEISLKLQAIKEMLAL